MTPRVLSAMLGSPDADERARAIAHVVEIAKRHGGDLSRTAKELGIYRSMLYRWLGDEAAPTDLGRALESIRRGREAAAANALDHRWRPVRERRAVEREAADVIAELEDGELEEAADGGAGNVLARHRRIHNEETRVQLESEIQRQAAAELAES